MSNNPILDDLYATRRKLLEESGGTLAGLVARLQAEQAASGRTILKTRRTRIAPKPQTARLVIVSRLRPLGESRRSAV